MQQAQFTTGPQYIAAAAANILNGAVASLAGPVGVTLPQPVIYIKKISIANTVSSARTFTLYVGATGASAGGTEIVGGTRTILANDTLTEFFGGNGLKLTSTQFLTGVASVASSLTIIITFEVGFQ